MTTNHRPTLESKRGRANPIKDTIQHARALKGQLELKLRPDIEGAKVSLTVVKRSLETPESSSKKVKTELTSLVSGNTDASSIESGSVTDDEREDGENQESREVIAELKRAKNEEDLRRKDQDKSTDSGRSSWRKTPFRRKKELEKSPKLVYTTDTVHSDTHQEFLSRYIR